MRNRSLKSEFIGVHSFHADPIIVNEFPGCLKAGFTAEFQPLGNSISTNFVEGLEFGSRPVGTVFFWLWKGFGQRLIATVCGGWGEFAMMEVLE